MAKAKSQYHLAERKLVEFYKRKKLPSIGAIWEDNVWINPIPSAPNLIFLKPSVKRHSLNVSKISKYQLNVEYTETLKAYVAYRLEHRGELAASISTELQILRKFAQFLTDRFTLFPELDLAAYELFINGITGTGNGPYSNTKLLNNFLKFLQEHGAINKLIRLRNPYSYHNSGNYSYVGEYKPQHKIASEDTLLAAADAFNFLVPESPATCPLYQAQIDAVCCSFFPLLMGAPDRINELALLKKQDLEEHFDSNSTHAGWTLDWPGSKRKEDFKKPFLDEIYTPLKRAIDFLTRIGEPARVMARYYEDQSITLSQLLAGGAELYSQKLEQYELEKPVANMWRLGSILGIFKGAPVPKSLSRISGFPDQLDCMEIIEDRDVRAQLFGMPRFGKTCPAFIYSENRIEHLQQAWINHIKNQIPTFPYRRNPNGKHVHLGNAMITLLGYQLHGTSNLSGSRSYPGSLGWFAIEPVNFITAFKKRLSGSSGTPSFFYLAGYPEEMNLRSHQIRHFLNTTMQRAGLSERIIATWSGRASVTQNAVYDHRTDEEKVERIAGILKEKNEDIIVIPVNDHEFKQKTGIAAAKQDTGYCIQNLDINPCQRLTNCIGCSRNCHVKGITKELEQIKINRDLALEKIKVLMQKESNLTVHKKWMDTLIKRYRAHEALLVALNDPLIEKGAIIRFENDDEPILRITSNDVTDFVEYKPKIPSLPIPDARNEENQNDVDPLQKMKEFLDELPSKSKNNGSIKELIDYKNEG